MITDEMLTIAAKELAEAIDGSLIDAKEYDHAFSSKFENKMEVLIKKVNKKKKYKTLKHIACFMLVAIIGLGALFTFKTSAREYLLN